MGAQYSAQRRNGALAMKAQPVTSNIQVKKQQVLSFHTSAKWRAHFEDSKATKKLMVIDFTAAWCAPCRFMEPTIKELAAKHTDVEFIKIDVDELMDVAREFGVHVMPTYILIKGGKVVDKVTGVKKTELLTKIEMHK